MLLTILMACTVGGSGPATPGSTAETELVAVQKIRDQAATIKELSGHLEGLTDSARAAAEGPAREEIIAQMRTVTADINEKNVRLQADVAALEARLHAAASDPLLSAPAEE
jgi:cytochrome c556